jgi:chemotaxis protein methyltransferase CheR
MGLPVEGTIEVALFVSEEATSLVPFLVGCTPNMAFTFFFRDAQTLELAIDEALPALRGRAFIHVWDAGCAHGPEPYTLAILLRERMSDYVFRNVHIHATDIDSSFAAQVTSGVFAEQEVQRVPPEILQKYFRPAGKKGDSPHLCEAPSGPFRQMGTVPFFPFVEVVAELRAKVAFSQHDLLSLSPVRKGLSLIVCKNVLLHFEESQRIEVLRVFHQALQPGGILVMEHTQKLPETLARFFQQVAPHAQVYRRVEPAFVEHEAEESVRPAHGRRRVDAHPDGALPHFGKAPQKQAHK